MKSKIFNLEQLTERTRRWRSENKRVVATNGCFDILHPGHVRYLEAARGFGDLLVVGVNGDESVRELKGSGRPLNRAKDRAEILAALETVDAVTIFAEPRATRFLLAAQPAIYVKGGDYRVENLNEEERAALEKLGTKIEIVPFEPGYSTSDLLTRIRQG